MPGDSYALITGASSGIGECFARKLAAQGRRLVLVARTRKKLDDLVRDLMADGSPDALVMDCDLSAPGSPAGLVNMLTSARIDVSLLINNAGFGIRDKFWNASISRQIDMLRLNIQAVVELTYGLLPAMLERKSGTIINVSSTGSFQPIPYMSAYGATKAFVTSFSMGLAEEVRTYGIIVVTLCPGGTETNFFKASGFARPNLPGGMQTAEQVVDAALRRIDKGGLVIPGLVNKLTVQSQRLAPRGFVASMSARLFRI